MSWSYNITSKILTSTGATKTQPDSLFSGIQKVATEDPTYAKVDGVFASINNVRIDIANNSWYIQDAYRVFEFKGTTRINPANETSNNAGNGGSVIFGECTVLFINTNTFYVDDNCRPCGNGGSVVSVRSSSGINPLFHQLTSVRNDYPTFDGALTPQSLDIAGLTIRNNGASRKIYFGRSRNIVRLKNVNFENNNGEYQTAQSVYDSFAFPTIAHAGDSFYNDSVFYKTKWGTEQTGVVDFALGYVRHGNYINYDPEFPSATWSGLYSGSNWSVDDRYAAVLYTSKLVFKRGSILLENVNVTFTGKITTGTRAYNLINIGESLIKTGVSDLTGTVSKYLLSAIRGREASQLQSSNKYKWSCKARSHNFRTAEEFIWIDKSFLADGSNGPSVEEIQMLPLAYAPINLNDGLAITGVSFDSTGNCILSVNEIKTNLEIFQAWCSHTTTNHLILDNWRYDGTTLNMGSSNLIGPGKAIGNFTTTGVISAEVSGLIIDSNNVGSISVIGALESETVEFILLSNNQIIGTRTGSGSFVIPPSLVGSTVYFKRLSNNELVMSTKTQPKILKTGINKEVFLFSGDEIQIAQAERINLLPTATEIWSNNKRTLNDSLFE